MHRIRIFTRALICFVVISSGLLYVARPVAAEELRIHAEAVYLLDAETGRTLFEKNGHERMYPASMTKILTAMIALEYITTTEVVWVGAEIRYLPALSSRAGVSMHEAIRGRNLIRLLLIPSGNEVAMVVAQNVAQRHTGRNNMLYAEAEEIFSRLMNQRALEIGATSSNFTNPHGFHDDDHYTTPRDFALIMRAALEMPVLAEILSESHFFGNGATANRDTRWVTRYHDVVTRNELVIESSPYFYPYATGGKTGFHDHAGETLVASAYRDGMKLIATIFDSQSPGRWLDAVELFEYGFNNFEERQVQAANSIIGEVPVEGARTGYADHAVLVAQNSHYEKLSLDELARIQRRIVLDEGVLALDEDGVLTYILAAPVEQGQVVGRVVYTLGDEFLFSDALISSTNVYARDLGSDLEYRLQTLQAFIFSLEAAPYWAGLVVFVCGIVHLIRLISERTERNYRKLPNLRRYH